MTKIQMRFYVLARELDLATEVVLRTAQRPGFNVKNGLSSLSPEHQAAIEKSLKSRPPDEPPLEPPFGVPSKLLRAIPDLTRRRND